MWGSLMLAPIMNILIYLHNPAGAKIFVNPHVANCRNNALFFKNKVCYLFCLIIFVGPMFVAALGIPAGMCPGYGSLYLFLSLNVRGKMVSFENLGRSYRLIDKTLIAKMSGIIYTILPRD